MKSITGLKQAALGTPIVQWLGSPGSYCQGPGSSNYDLAYHEA